MQDTYAGMERRANKRLRMNCTVVYRTDEPSTTRVSIGDHDVQAKMLDISETGMAMVTDTDIPISTVLSMRFTLLKVNKDVVKLSGPMEAVGEVRSSVETDEHEHRLGIFFRKMRKVHVA